MLKIKVLYLEFVEVLFYWVPHGGSLTKEKAGNSLRGLTGDTTSLLWCESHYAHL